MKSLAFNALAVCLILAFYGCLPQLVHPVVPYDYSDNYIDYDAQLVFSPETTLNVTIQLSPSVSARDSFCFPIQIPGTYEIKKYGKFISQFSAYDVNGQSISYKKVDSTFYLFDSSTPVNKIKYVVYQASIHAEDSLDYIKLSRKVLTDFSCGFTPPPILMSVA
jgi:hypothetical protein